MISVVIPTFNAPEPLAATLTALVPAVVDGAVREVIVADGQSTDATREVADAAGATIIDATRGRGVQLQAGGEIARHDWLLFLHADTVLEPDWQREAARLIEQVETGGRRPTAAVFRFKLDDLGVWPRILEWGVAVRCSVCAMPYGDQGLLISRKLYDEIGGFKPMPLFEDVDIVRRLGRRRIARLSVAASTSAARYKRSGYASCVLRNWWCVLLYYLGTSPDRLAKIYNA